MNKTRADNISRANGLISEALELLREAMDEEEEELEEKENSESLSNEDCEALEDNISVLQEAVVSLETVECDLYKCYDDYIL